MNPSSTVVSARRWLALSFAVSLAAIASADVYISPGGTGNKSGTNTSNTKPASLLQNEIVNLTPGNTIFLVAGTYNLNQLSIVGSGSAGSPKKIEGKADPVTGALPLIQSMYDPDVQATATEYLFKFVNYNGAETSYWEFRNLRIDKQGFVFEMPLNGETFTLRQNLVFENLAMTNVEDGIRIRNASNVTVRNCSVIGHAKKAFRIGFFSRYITFDGCDTDVAGVKARSIPVGFGTDSPDYRPIIHDIRYIDCTAQNNGFSQAANKYWNGDGFSSERGVYNLTYSGCVSSYNNDGGFDDKATNVLYENCISVRNKRGFRLWSNATLINCLVANNKKWGGTSNSVGVWLGSAGATASIFRSTFHDNENAHLYNESGTLITATDSILSTDGDGLATSVPTISSATHSVTLTGTATYSSYVTGFQDPDPNYPNTTYSDWVLSPPEAYNPDFLVYPTKGYFYQGAASTAPAAPSSIIATVNATQADRIDLTWTDNSTNESGFTVQRSTNGGAYVAIGSTGTNAARYMDAGLTPATSYAYRITAYNSAGSSTFAATATSTAATATPTPPSSLTFAPTLDTDSEVTISWNDNSNDESSFEIQRSIDGTNFTALTSVVENSTFYVDPTVAANTLLWYRVRAVNSAGSSAWVTQSYAMPWVEFIDNLNTAKVSMTPNPAPTPTVWNPATLTDGYWKTDYHANTTSGTPATFTFTPTIPVAGSYQVYMRWTEGGNRASNLPVDLVGSSGTTTVTVNEKVDGGQWNLLGTVNFAAGTSGHITIRNTGVNGAVIADAVRIAATTQYGPATPRNLVATSTGATTIGLTWIDRSAIETSYQVERSVDDGETWAIIGSAAANATSYSDTTVTAGANYYYRVRTMAAPSGGCSNIARAFTPQTVVVDNGDAVQVTQIPAASWTTASAVTPLVGSDYIHDGNTSVTSAKTVIYRPGVLPDGTYQISVCWTANTNRAHNARYYVAGAYGRMPYLANQTTDGSQWVPLGTFQMRQGSSVMLVNEGADAFVISDAVKFVRTGF